MTVPSRLATVSLAALAPLASGCWATLATEAEDSAAKRFVPPAGRANVYVVRIPAVQGSAVLAHVACRTVMSEAVVFDDTEEPVAEQHHAKIDAGTYALFHVLPSEQSVSVRLGSFSTHTGLRAVAGQNYFLRLDAPSFFSLRLAQVGDGLGRSLVDRRRLVATTSSTHN